MFWLAAVPVGAQGLFDVPVGARIRVQTRGETAWKVGEVTGLRPDTIGVRLCQNFERSQPREGDQVVNSHTTMMGQTVYWVRDCHPNLYALTNLERIQVSDGRHHSAGRAAWGLLFGGMIGFAASVAVAGYQVKHCAPNDDMCELNYLLVPPATLAGLVAGGVVGALTVGETWRPVSYGHY